MTELRFGKYVGETGLHVIEDEGGLCFVDRFFESLVAGGKVGHNSGDARLVGSKEDI